MPPPDGVLVFLWLKGCAECVARFGCVLRTYCNLVCRAVRITIVVVAVLYVAFDTLDMLVTTIFVLFHFHFSYLPCGFVQKTLCLRCI